MIQSEWTDPWEHEDRSSTGCGCYHEGRYGIEIMMDSSFGDGTRSLVMIVHGLNKCVDKV